MCNIEMSNDLVNRGMRIIAFLFDIHWSCSVNQFLFDIHWFYFYVAGKELLVAHNWTNCRAKSFWLPITGRFCKLCRSRKSTSHFYMTKNRVRRISKPFTPKISSHCNFHFIKILSRLRSFSREILTDKFFSFICFWNDFLLSNSFFFSFSIFFFQIIFLPFFLHFFLFLIHSQLFFII